MIFFFTKIPNTKPPFQAEFDTWKSELNIESALNADYTKYECRAENELGDDKFNISLVPPR